MHLQDSPVAGAALATHRTCQELRWDDNILSGGMTISQHSKEGQMLCWELLLPNQGVSWGPLGSTQPLFQSHPEVSRMQRGA